MHVYLLVVIRVYYLVIFYVCHYHQAYNHASDLNYDLAQMPTTFLLSIFILESRWSVIVTLSIKKWFNGGCATVVVEN